MSQPLSQQPPSSQASQQRRHRGPKQIADPIHEFVVLDALCVDVADSRAVQRLRYLRQLGLTHWVYPSAMHNRFAHSLGVSHLAATWVDALLKRDALEGGGSGAYSTPYTLDSPYVKLAALAGLCHDLGHGAFSHMFEYMLLPAVLGADAARGWAHERMSCVLFEHVLDARGIELEDYGLLRSDAAVVQSLMLGRDAPAAGGGGNSGNGGGAELEPGGACARDAPPPAWLWDIVANKRTSVDVDKLDYLRRDAYSVGSAAGVKGARILQCAKALGGEVAFHAKAFPELSELFHTRYKLHRDVYTHSKVKSVEFMLCDALQLAEPATHLAERLRAAGGAAGGGANINEFLKLTDESVLEPLRSWDPDRSDNAEALRKAQAVWRRVEDGRSLYAFIDEAVVPPALVDALLGSRSDAELGAEIASLQSADGQVDLQPRDLIVSRARIDYSMRGVDPRRKIHFFKAAGDGNEYLADAGVSAAGGCGGGGGGSQGSLSQGGGGGGGGGGHGQQGGDAGFTKFRMDPRTVSHLLPATFEEVKLRLHCRLTDPRAQRAAADAFRRWGARHLATRDRDSPFSTPHKMRALDGGGEGGDGDRPVRAAVKHPLFV